jgi:hypothetical protein
MKRNLSPSVKKQLATLVCTAHETALRSALSELARHFESWQRGEIDSFKMADCIHEFHQGPSQAIYKRFTYHRNDDLPMLAASAIATSLIDEKDVPAEVLPHVKPWLEFHRRGL